MSIEQAIKRIRKIQSFCPKRDRREVREAAEVLIEALGYDEVGLKL